MRRHLASIHNLCSKIDDEGTISLNNITKLKHLA